MTLTDKETIIAMLLRVGIGFTLDETGSSTVTLQADSGFYIEFAFDAAGKLTAIGAWE